MQQNQQKKETKAPILLGERFYVFVFNLCIYLKVYNVNIINKMKQRKIKYKLGTGGVIQEKNWV